MQYKITD